MDERELRERLTDAAESVAPSGDLETRAERRYLRRRNRVRTLGSVVAIAVIASGVATAAIVSRKTTNRIMPAVRPTTTTLPEGPAVDPKEVGTLSFVDADLGFGLVHAPGVSMQSIVRTGDGGRTWHVVSTLQTANTFVHFEDASRGVLWGEGALQATTDGGVHWRVPATGPTYNALAWSGGRLWAASCLRFEPCDSPALLVSDDSGSTWRTTSPLRSGLHATSILAMSRMHVYVVETAEARPGSGPNFGPWNLARTNDGGATWDYEPTPCISEGKLAYNGDTLLLICQATRATSGFSFFTSDDQGATWSSTPQGQLAFRSVEALTSLGANFVVGIQNGGIWSSPDGKAWHLSPGDSRFRWFLDALPGVGVWATNSDGPGARIWFSPDGVHWEQRAGG